MQSYLHFQDDEWSPLVALANLNKLNERWVGFGQALHVVEHLAETLVVFERHSALS